MIQDKKINTVSSVIENSLLENNNKSNSSQEPLISSMELVELINRLRDSDKLVTHANFLKKVPIVLKGGQVKFYSSYINSQNKEQPCYYFPKREASLMGMAYSYEVQAGVYDYMAGLEIKVQQINTVDSLLSNPDFAITLFQQLKEEREKFNSIQLELKSKNDIILNLADRVPDTTMRATINKLVRQVKNDYQVRWNTLYYEFKYRYNIDLKTRAKHSGKSCIEEAQIAGKLEELYLLAIKLFEASKINQSIEVL
jgi:hypothetical protein